MHSLGLSFESAEELYRKICTDLPQAPWFNQITVRMKEAPIEPQMVVHRNILECVDYLFERPCTSGIDFEPESRSQDMRIIQKPRESSRPWHS